MVAENLSLEHLVRQSRVPSVKPPLLLMLHGVGSNEEDLFDLAPYFDERLLILSARAPLTLAPGSYAWWPFDSTPQDVVEARRVLLGFIGEAVQAYAVGTSRVYLMGFSQGAILALMTLLVTPGPLAGVVAMSGRVLPEAETQAAARERLQGFPILVQHGLYDTVLPIEYGRASRDYLSTLPVDLTYREYPMAHQINEASLADAREWLSERLSKTDGKRING